MTLSMLPDLKLLKIKLVYNNEEYKNTVLSKRMIYNLRTVLKHKYRFSLVWELLFSSFLNGFSYRTMLNAVKSHSGPFVLIAKTPTRLFGFYSEDVLEVCLHPYGRRNRFLFELSEEDIVVDALELEKDLIVCTDEFLSIGFNQFGYKFSLDKTLTKLTIGSVNPETFSIHYLELYNIIE